MIAFFYYFAALGAILSGSMVLPALIAFGFEETLPAYRMLLYGALGGFVSVSVLLAIMGRLGGIERNTAILLAVFSWIVFPALTAIPVADIANIGYVDALFQTTASLTTAGSNGFENPDVVPKSLIYFLAQLQWMGGLATLVTLILVLAPWEIGGLPQVSSASIAASIVASQSRIVKFCGQVSRVFLFLTLMCFMFLVLAGISPYNAVILSFTALSTGGIVPTTESLDLQLGVSGMVIMSVFLIIGATSIFWHKNIATVDLDELRTHRESYYVIALCLILAVFISYKLFSVAGSSTVLPYTKAMGEGLFNAASIVSTSGLQSRPGVFSLLPPTLVLLIIFIGGGCYSTSGGIKVFRIGGMYSLAQYELNRLIYPSSVKPARFGSTAFDLEIMKAIWSLFAVLIITVAISSCLLSVSGLNFQASFTASIAAVTNAGPLYGPDWAASGSEGWPAYFEMLRGQKLVLTAVMLLGRLEVIAVVASLTVLLRGGR